MLLMAEFPRYRPGQPIGLRDAQGRIRINASLAKALNDAAAELKRLGNLTAQPPLRLTEDASGRRFALDRPPEIWAKLSGSANPYSFTEQSYDPDTNSWSDRTGGRTGDDCYEARGLTDLDGKVVRIGYERTSNDWRFQYVGYGCKWTFVVKDGCTGVPLSGASVSLSQAGVEVASCSSAAVTGECTLDVPAGTYDVTITPPSGTPYAAYSATLSHTCGETTTVSLDADSDSQCIIGCGPCSIYPKEITITWNRAAGPSSTGTAFGDETLVYSSDPLLFPIAGGHWLGSEEYDFPLFDPPAPKCKLVMICTNVSNQTLAIWAVRTDGGGGDQIAAASFAAVTCSPFSVVGGVASPIFTDSTAWSALG